jgi:hypothetical protein
MFNLGSKRGIEAIKARLIELGVQISKDKKTGKIKVFLMEGQIRASQELEVGFLLGQWSFLVGIQFPRDFPKSIMKLSNKLSMDCDPSGVWFEFISP